MEASNTEITNLPIILTLTTECYSKFTQAQQLSATRISMKQLTFNKNYANSLNLTSTAKFYFY